MSVGIVVVVGYMIWEAYTGSFKGKNAITGLWALATYVGYFIGENCKSNICRNVDYVDCVDFSGCTAILYKIGLTCFSISKFSY